MICRNLLFHLRRVGGGGRHVDLAQAVLLRSARGFQPLQHVVHLVAGDVDEGRDIAPDQRLPGKLALYLPLEGGGRGTDGAEVSVHRLGILPEVLHRHPGKGLLHPRLLDGQFLHLGGLDLQRFVDKVAQHLLAQAQHLLGPDLRLAGGND